MCFQLVPALQNLSLDVLQCSRSHTQITITPGTRMSDDLMSRARAVLASMRASREAPLREQGSDGPPAVQSTASARESVDALVARHTMRQHLQSANLQPVAQALRAAAPAPPAARAAPAAQTSARESVSALIDRHMKRQRLQSASQQSVAHIPLATAPPPSTAQAASTATTLLAAAPRPSAVQAASTITSLVAAPPPSMAQAASTGAAIPARAPSAPYVPWREYTTRVTGVDPGPGSGQQTLLLGEPVEPPPGWMPRVHGLAGESRELQRRALEASRIVPAIATSSWTRIFDEPLHELQRWPAPRLLGEKLDAVCRVAGHSRLAAMRCEIHKLDAFCVREYGNERLAIMDQRLSATRLRGFLREGPAEGGEGSHRRRWPVARAGAESGAPCGHGR